MAGQGVILGEKKSKNLKYLENAGEFRESKRDVIPQYWDPLFAGMLGLGQLPA